MKRYDIRTVSGMNGLQRIDEDPSGDYVKFSEADAEITRLLNALEEVIRDNHVDYDDYPELHDKITEALNSEDVSSECVWKQEDWEYGPIWNAECGASWVFIEGGPEDNNIKYCHSCGKLIRLSKTEEVSSE